MRNAVIGFILLAILIMSGISINTVNTKTMRQNELDTNLNRSIESSLELLKVDIANTMTDTEFAADAMQNVMQGVQSDSDCRFVVYQADAKKGILDLEVIETYQQVLGTGSVRSRKVIIYDDWANDENTYYTVIFKDTDNQTVKELKIPAKNTLSGTVLPQSLDGVTGWKLLTNGNVYTKENIGNVVAIGNLTFIAVRG